MLTETLSRLGFRAHYIIILRENSFLLDTVCVTLWIIHIDICICSWAPHLGFNFAQTRCGGDIGTISYVEHSFIMFFQENNIHNNIVYNLAYKNLTNSFEKYELPNKNSFVSYIQISN